MSQFLVRCRIPLADLGKVSLPPRRMAYQDGYIRLGLNRSKTQVVATLEDREGVVVPQPTLADAVAKAHRMGQALCIRLLEHNRQYALGEATT